MGFSSRLHLGVFKASFGVSGVQLWVHFGGSFRACLGVQMRVLEIILFLHFVGT